MNKFANTYEPNKGLLASLLNKRIDDVNYMIVRYQQLVSNEAQQKYFLFLQTKTAEIKSENERISMSRYYDTELNKFRNENVTIKNFMEEVNQRNKTTEIEIAKIRQTIEGKDLILDTKIFNKFDLIYKDYMDKVPMLQKISNQLEKAAIYKKISQDGIDKKEAEEIKIYANIFSKYNDEKSKYDTIINQVTNN
jgi:hypothetical protein